MRISIRPVSVLLRLAVLILLSPFLVAVVAVLRIREAAAFRGFLRREKGNAFLVCTSRRNAYDFLRNNLIPGLPAGVRVVWRRPGLDPMYPVLRRHLGPRYGWGVSKPFLAAVTADGLRVKSLNEALRPWRADAGRSPEARLACKRILTEAFEELGIGQDCG